MINQSRAAIVLATVLVIGGCTPSPPPASPTTTNPPASSVVIAQPPSLRFRDATDGSGISFVQDSGYNVRKDFPVSLGSGVSIFDYDGDGKLDLYFCSLRGFPLATPSKSMGNRLYRNLGGLKFEDVTEKAKVGYKGFCHGAAVGDLNADGKPDLYLTTYGSNVLYLNNGDGTFRDGSANSGCDLKGWSSGAALFDYDLDGKLDLYVTRYGQWTEDGPHEYTGDKARGIRTFMTPFQLEPQTHVLLKGNGDGTFVETTAAAGILRRDGRGLGVVAADINRDGKTDLYVANDGCPNFLFLNKGDGTFEDLTESSGADRDAAGNVQGSMGVDVQDMDGDGRPELFVTNYRGQYNTLYRNLDGRTFQDVSAAAGLVKDSLAYVGWGCALGDLDNDGQPDVFVVNGEVDDNLPKFGQEIDFEQPTVVWRNVGQCRFVRVESPGPFFAKNHAGRGLAMGDLDDDGDLDAVVVILDAKPALLINESLNAGNWIRFELEGARGGREAIGATVDVHAGGKVFQRLVRGGDSYLSVNDRRVLIGIGGATKVDKVDIMWPGGKTTTIEGPVVNRTHRVVEGPGGDRP